MQQLRCAHRIDEPQFIYELEPSPTPSFPALQHLNSAARRPPPAPVAGIPGQGRRRAGAPPARSAVHRLHASGAERRAAPCV